MRTQSISLSKLAGLMDMDETSLRSQLMLLKQVRLSAQYSVSVCCVAQTAPLQPSSAHVLLPTPEDTLRTVEPGCCSTNRILAPCIRTLHAQA